MKHPGDMGEPEIEQFLAHLAVDRKVSSSTQNQALSAILFLYREVVGKASDISREQKIILLVDDVLTSGATVEECTKTLLVFGAANVDILTPARTMKRIETVNWKNLEPGMTALHDGRNDNQVLNQSNPVQTNGQIITKESGLNNLPILNLILNSYSYIRIFFLNFSVCKKHAKSRTSKTGLINFWHKYCI